MVTTIGLGETRFVIGDALGWGLCEQLLQGKAVRWKIQEQVSRNDHVLTTDHHLAAGVYVAWSVEGDAFDLAADASCESDGVSWGGRKREARREDCESHDGFAQCSARLQSVHWSAHFDFGCLVAIGKRSPGALVGTSRAMAIRHWRRGYRQEANRRRSF